MSASAARATVAVATLAATAATAQPISVAQLGYVEGRVERVRAADEWRPADEGGEVQIGDRYRTGLDSRLRIDFPWMSVAIDSSSLLSIPNSVVLSAVLEHGRVEPFSSTGSIIKLVTAEANVRGEGRVVVRRREQDRTTYVSVRSGRFRVQAGDRVPVDVAQGKGLVVGPDTEELIVVALAEPPTGISPTGDPAYLRRGSPAALSWDGAPGGSFHVELLAHDGGEVILGRDASGSGTSLELAWLGTFRWRVAAIAPNGLEGMPSKAGVLCVVER